MVSVMMSPVRDEYRLRTLKYGRKGLVCEGFVERLLARGLMKRRPRWLTTVREPLTNKKAKIDKRPAIHTFLHTLIFAQSFKLPDYILIYLRKQPEVATQFTVPVSGLVYSALFAYMEKHRSAIGSSVA